MAEENPGLDALGNYESVATIRDIPDLAFSFDSLDVSAEIACRLLGVDVDTKADGTELPLDIASLFKTGRTATYPVRHRRVRRDEAAPLGPPDPAASTGVQATDLAVDRTLADEGWTPPRSFRSGSGRSAASNWPGRRRPARSATTSRPMPATPSTR